MGAVPFAVRRVMDTRRAPFGPVPTYIEVGTDKVHRPIEVALVMLSGLIHPDPSGTPAIVDSVSVGASLGPVVAEWLATMSETSFS